MLLLSTSIVFQVFAVSLLVAALAVSIPSQALASSLSEKEAQKNKRMIEQGLLVRPNDPMLLSAKAHILMQQNEYEEALKICNDQLAVAPVQVSHNRYDSIYNRYVGPQDLMVTKGSWLLLRAELLYKLKRFEDALKDCDASLGMFTRRGRAQSFFLKSKTLFALGKTEAAQSAFNEGAYLLASQNEERYENFHFMTDAAMTIGIRKDPVKESPDSFIETYAAEHFKPRTEHVDEVLNLVDELAHMKAPNTVAELNTRLVLEQTSEIRNGQATSFLFSPTEMWRSVQYDLNQSYFSRQELNLQPDILFACVTHDAVLARFGEPYRTVGYVSHSDPTALRYITPDYELNFNFSHKGFKALTNVRIEWCDEFCKAAHAKAKADREKREAAEGSESAMIVQNVKALVGQKLPTKETIEKLFEHKLNPLRQTNPKSWSLGYQNPSYNGPVDVDYQITFAPNGQLHSAAQLQLRPGEQNHKVSREQVESLLPCTVISVPKFDPQPANNRLTSLSHRGEFGSLTIVCDTSKPGSPVEELLFWWRGNNSASTLEEFEKGQTVLSTCESADDAISRGDYERARFLLDRSFNRIEASGQKADAEQFEQLSQIRAGYLKLFTSLKMPKEIAYLKRTSCYQLFCDLSDPADVSAFEGKYFPTIDMIKGKWTVRKSHAGLSLQSSSGGTIMARNAADEELLRKLYTFGTDGAKQIEYPPPDLIDSIYFDLKR